MTFFDEIGLNVSIEGEKTEDVGESEVDYTYVPVLSLGDEGPEVKAIQEFLGIRQTGVFDRPTRNRVRNFQKEHGLERCGTWGAAEQQVADRLK